MADAQLRRDPFISRLRSLFAHDRPRLGLIAGGLDVAFGIHRVPRHVELEGGRVQLQMSENPAYSNGLFDADRDFNHHALRLRADFLHHPRGGA